MTKVAKKNQAQKNTHTTIVVNDTIYNLELSGTIPCEFETLQVLKKSTCEVTIPENTNETDYVLVRKQQKDQLRRQISFSRREFINNQRIIIRYDEKERYVDVVI
jgi:hypothetical protein